MSEDNKPIFPRPTEISEEEKQRIYAETGQKLESPVMSPSAPREEFSVVYGPPPVPVPAYGPPPIRGSRNWVIWIVIGSFSAILFLLVTLIIFSFVFYFYFR